MSGCPAYGDRLGGFVLGSLEPSEMDEMRRHVAECPQCGPEAGNLSSLPGLLDEIEPADVPPPTLSPAVEEAVLDRFVRERRPRRRAQRRWLRLGGLVAACAAAAVLAIVLIGGSDDEGSTAYAWAELDPVAAGSGAAGSAWVDEVPAGTRVRLRASGLPEETYELWCVREDGSWVSGGTFRADARGKAEAVLTAAVRPGDYHVVVIAEDGGDGPHGAAMLRGRLKY
jgi:anti-sigma-K factor RskA